MLKIYLLLFYIYSFIGWILEVFAKIKEKGKLVNRGFLIGPLCPIYGFGAVFMTIFLSSYDKNPFLLFLLAVFLCSLLEYFTSYILEIIFKARWWDYSNRKFNINGRICMATMIPFGVLALLMTYVLNPFIYDVLKNINASILNSIIIVVSIVFCADIIVSVSILFKYKKTIILTGKDNTEELSLLKRKKLKNDRIYQYRLLNVLPSALQMEKFIKENYNKTKEIINDKQLLLKKKAEFKIKYLKKKYDNKVENIQIKTKQKIKKINSKKNRDH